MESVSHRELHLIGWLLVVGAVIFWIGAGSPPYKQWTSPLKEYLQVVGSHRWQWYWIHVCFLLATILTVVGVRLLASAIQRNGEYFFSEIGAVGFTVACILWILSIAFRVTVDYEAGVLLNASGEKSEWITPLHRWSGLLFAIFMVVGYLSEALIGKALAGTSLVPSWVATASFYFGIAGAIGYCVRFPLFDPPLMMHVIPFFIGYYLIKLS
jgi:hypothetical protein